MSTKKILSLAALSALGMGSLTGAQRADSCPPSQPAPCYSEDCGCTYCFGPTNGAGNPAVRPRTCNADFVIEVAGFYWNAHQDGMEYAIKNHVALIEAPRDTDILQLNNLIDAEYQTPNFDWDFGFKAGIGYHSACDGWDFGINWTWYQGKANDHIEAELDDNRSLIPLWSAFASPAGLINYASDIETHWKLDMNVIDLELGREFWNSPKLSLRPFVGLRIAYLNQNYKIEHKGGSWSRNDSVLSTPEDYYWNNEVSLNNDYHGVGIRAGLDSTWNFGCGWGLYGNLAASILYGKFDLSSDEANRRASSPHEKVKILDTSESFRASRAVLDLGLGVQWSALFCACQYGLTAQLGWEQHIFFHQNQLWRVVRVGDEFSDQSSLLIPNNTGENVFHQRRGNLDTQGWTLRLMFEF